MTQYTVFETAIGWAGLAWGDNGLVGAWLPDADPHSVRAAIRRRLPGATESAAPADLQATIDGVRALMRGEAADFSHTRLELERVSEFNRRVYALAQAIPAGETLTYGQLAQKLGDIRLAQQVGQALGQNPWPIIVPCHRIIAAGGKLGGFSAPGGAQTKMKLLQIEGAAAAAQRDLFR